VQNRSAFSQRSLGLVVNKGVERVSGAANIDRSKLAIQLKWATRGFLYGLNEGFRKDEAGTR
jgi:hypothetical protein